MVGALGTIVSRTELYTPWREDATRLQARTVGRDTIVRRVVDEARRFAAGERVRPLYLFGPRGVGKSHIIALAAAEFEALGLTLVLVPEDVAATTTAAKLLDRCRPNADDWLSDDVAGTLDARHVLVVEGLDRRFADLGSGPEGLEARQVLRRHWADRPIWLIGTGVALTSPLTDREEPFYAHFDPEAIQPLSTEDARALIDRSAPDHARARPRWSARRDTLVTLAGGSPRVLVSLAEDCADDTGPESASEALLAAVDRFTPHYQLRFRDLPPTGQEIVSLIARSPTMLTPTEIANKLGTHPAAVGTQARRLADDGVIVGTPGPNGTPYHLAEPLFRFWLEYRTGRWEDTRVAVASQVLEVLFASTDIVDRWWKGTSDAVIDHAVVEGESRSTSVAKLYTQVDALKVAPSEGLALQLLQRAGPLKEVGVAASVVDQYATTTPDTPVLRRLLPDLAQFPGVLAVCRFVVELAEGTRPKAARARLLPDLAEHRPLDFREAQIVTRIVISALDRGAGPGKPWTLTSGERNAAARIPYLRAAFLDRGRLVGHPPVLAPNDLVKRLTDVDPDLSILVAAVWTRPDAEALLDRILLERTATSFHGLLFACPHPTHHQPRYAQAITQWTIEDLTFITEALWTPALTWARAWADTDEASFTELLKALQGHQDVALYGDLSRAIPALVAFGAASPERMRRFLAAAPPALVPTARKAAGLALQIAATGAGPLHPELAALRSALNAG